MGDIEEVFPSADVMETPYTDYRYRAWLPRSEVTQALSRYVEDLHEHQEAQCKYAKQRIYIHRKETYLTRINRQDVY